MHKEDFPFFDYNKHIVYLDNAASSQTPRVVVESMNEYYYQYRANIHRGVYEISEKASERYDEVRATAAEFFSVNRDDIILTSGSTAASNMLMRMIEQHIDWQEGDMIITSYYEHHSILLPIIELAKRKKLIIQYIDHGSSSINGEQGLNEKVKLVSLTMASNITGEIFDVSHMFKTIKTINDKIICISDMTAIAGHRRIALGSLSVDAAWCGAHKMCGPTGAGILYMKRDLSRMMQPVIWGGGMVWKVEKNRASYRSDIEVYEAGTSNVAGIIGMGAGLRYIEGLGLRDIELYIEKLHGYALSQLEKLNYVKLYTSNSTDNVGIISFAMYNDAGKPIHPHDIAQILGDNNIAVRSGHHCAQLYMNYIDQPALTRLSLYFYNDENDIDKLIEVLHKVKDKFSVL